MEKSNSFEQKVDIEDIILTLKNNLQNLHKLQNEKSVTAEYLQKIKKKIWKDKVTSCDLSTLTTKLLQILDQESTLKEKASIPFWTPQSKEMSQKLWLPTKTDCVDSVLKSCSESLPKGQMGSSWFSIKKKLPQMKSSLATSFQLSQYSPHESTDSRAIKSKRKLKKQLVSKEEKLKTMKFRLFPSNEEKEKLKESLGHFRWYYNTVTHIVTKMKYGTLESLVEQKKLSYISIRNELRKYSYSEENIEGNLNRKYERNESNNTFPQPKWMENSEVFHSRIPCGACKKFTQNINSAISNYKNGNIRDFKMKFKSSKDPQDFMLFDDTSYPRWIREIESKYWYITKDRKRKTVSFKDICNIQPRGFEIIHDKVTDRFFLHYPVDINYFPENSVRNENHIAYSEKGERIISLDPGIRKFLVGYDPAGELIYVGEDASKQIITQILQVDLLNSKNEQLLAWKKIRNLVDEMHNKTIAYLIKNYDVIILPEFRTQQMLRNPNLSKKTKRLMCMYAFFRFKEKLMFKCNQYGKQLIVVDESYTSRTCTCCGHLNEKKTTEFLICSECKIELDRDVIGSRNIFIKNMVLR